MVAMVGLNAIQMGEDTPMDCEDECAEWDIRNEFETVNGMPVYYGGDLYDSDESEWEDPYNLAYAEYVDQYNFDALEGMELKVFERLQGPDESVMMVGVVTDSRHVSSSKCSILEADMGCTEPEADIITVGHDVPEVAGSPIRRSSNEIYGDGAAVPYEGDVSDSDCESVEDRERDTWEDWCGSAFRNGYGGFPPDTDDSLPPVVFSTQLFWDEDMAEPSRMRSDCGDVPVSALQGFTDTVVPLVPPNTDRFVRIYADELALMDRFVICRFTVMIWTLEYRTVTLNGYAFCISPAWGMRGTIPLQLEWTVGVWIIGEELSGTQVLWVNNAYSCVMIASA